MDRYFAKSMPSTGSFVSRMYCPQLLSFSLLGTFQFHWCVDNRMLHVSLNFVQLCGWFLSVVWLVQWCVSSLLISSSTTVYELYSLDNLMSLWLFVVITVLCEFDLCSDREPDEWIWKFQSVIFISKRHWPLDKLRKGYSSLGEVHSCWPISIWTFFIVLCNYRRANEWVNINVSKCDFYFYIRNNALTLQEQLLQPPSSSLHKLAFFRHLSWGHLYLLLCAKIEKLMSEYESFKVWFLYQKFTDPCSSFKHSFSRLLPCPIKSHSFGICHRGTFLLLCAKIEKLMSEYESFKVWFLYQKFTDPCSSFKHSFSRLLPCPIKSHSFGICHRGTFLLLCAKIEKLMSEYESFKVWFLYQKGTDPLAASAAFFLAR